MKRKVTGKIKIVKNGPYLISGGLSLEKDIVVSDKEGIPSGWKKGYTYPRQDTYSLCRCGQSTNKPFCDGTHVKTGFNGTETSSRAKYDELAETIIGPGLALKDNEKFCSTGLFCHRSKDAWNLTEDSANEESKQTAIQEACDCPSGRIVACDKKTGKPIETDLEPSLGLIEDPARKVSGPLRVKGGVPVESSDGSLYEVRNRVTLCRCGQSRNKPFCDGTHVAAKFQDGDKSVD